MEGKIQNQIAKKSPEKKTMQQYIQSMEGEIKKALPSVITPERFTDCAFCHLREPEVGKLHPVELPRRNDD